MVPTLESSAPTHQSAVTCPSVAPTAGPDASSHSAAAVPRTAFVGLILCLIGFWALQHPYGGLIQDSVLYAMGAFGRLHPESLGQDLYLSAGSQDHYTLFSPLVAQVMRLVGVGWAAVLMTLASQAAFYGAGWMLARRLMPAPLAILAVAFLVMLPSLFGPNHIFWYTEDIMTPRVPSEAFVLAALACALGRRYLLAALCFCGAMLLHPLMGVAGIVMLYMLWIGLERPRLTAGLALAALATVGLIAWLIPFGRFARFDPVWFSILHGRLQYIFPSLWSLRDWGRMSVPLATLIAGASMKSSSTARTVCRAALATWIAAITIALIGADLLHVVVVTQAQAWRWLWLTNATAVVLIPVVATDCWRAGSAARALLLLLVAAWMSFEQIFVPILTILAIIVAAVRYRPRDETRDRRLLVGAWIIVALAFLFFFGFAATNFLHQPLAARGLTFLQSAFWMAMHRVKPWTVDGIIPAAIFSAIWWAAAHPADRGAAARVLVFGMAICCAFAPFAWFSWSDPTPSEQVRARFAPWRRDIPPTAQVLAPGPPIVPWFLLERPSYWTLRQMAGVVYSRSLAMRFLRREEVFHHFPPAPTAAAVLDGMCRSDRQIGFIVTPVDMGPSPFTPISILLEGSAERLHLYRCSDHLRTADPATHQARPSAE